MRRGIEVKIGLCPEITSHKEKGRVTIEQSLGCPKSAVLQYWQGLISLVYVHA